MNIQVNQEVIKEREQEIDQIKTQINMIKSDNASKRVMIQTKENHIN